VLREDLARLAPPPFEHEERDADVARLVRIFAAAALEHPRRQPLRLCGDPLALCEVVRLVRQHREHEFLARAIQRVHVIVARVVGCHGSGEGPPCQCRLALERVGQRQSPVGFGDRAASAGIGGGIRELCEVGLTLRAGLGEASAVRETGDQCAAVDDPVDLLLAAAVGGAGPLRQAVDRVESRRKGPHPDAVVAAMGDEQPEHRLRAGAEAGIPRRGRQPHRFLRPGEGPLPIVVAA
jgi:hypothetical protein